VRSKNQQNIAIAPARKRKGGPFNLVIRRGKKEGSGINVASESHDGGMPAYSFVGKKGEKKEVCNRTSLLGRGGEKHG